MAEIIISGAALGFLLSLLVGPVFFQMIEVSVRKGRIASLAFAMGVWLSDIAILTLSVLFMDTLLVKLRWGNIFLTLLAGLLFLVFGLYKLRTQYRDAIKSVASDRRWLLLSGSILNSINPSVWGFWLASVPLAKTVCGDVTKAMMLYYVITFLVAIFLDCLKIMIAAALKQYLSPRVIYRLNKFTGILFLLTGLWMLWKGLNF